MQTLQGVPKLYIKVVSKSLSNILKLDPKTIEHKLLTDRKFVIENIHDKQYIQLYVALVLRLVTIILIEPFSMLVYKIIKLLFKEQSIIKITTYENVSCIKDYMFDPYKLFSTIIDYVVYFFVSTELYVSHFLTVEVYTKYLIQMTNTVKFIGKIYSFLKSYDPQNLSVMTNNLVQDLVKHFKLQNTEIEVIYNETKHLIESLFDVLDLGIKIRKKMSAKTSFNVFKDLKYLVQSYVVYGTVLTKKLTYTVPNQIDSITFESEQIVKNIMKYKKSVYKIGSLLIASKLADLVVKRIAKHYLNKSKAYSSVVILIVTASLTELFLQCLTHKTIGKILSKLQART